MRRYLIRLASSLAIIAALLTIIVQVDTEDGPTLSVTLTDEDGNVFATGTLKQATGDGIMALFGAHIALEDAPQRAIRSAYAIHRFG